jgi:hypothetical protein
MIIYDAEFHKLGESKVAKELDPAIVTMFAQVNPFFYLEIRSNPPANNYNYILSVVNETAQNPEFSDNEKFSQAQEINITAGKTLNGLEQYLDKSYDFADFYKFDALKEQKILIDLEPSSNINDDFDMFLFSSQMATPGNWIKSSEASNQDEKILFFCPKDDTYYLRVAVKNIADPNLRNMGDYTIKFEGNIPPQWNTSFPTNYVMDEDGPSQIIPITQAYYEKNVGNEIHIEVFNPNIGVGGDWVRLSDISSISLTNLTISTQGELIKDLKIKPKPNKFGVDVINIRATDNHEENYTEQDLTVKIRPTNDPPVLNGTNHWIITSGLTPSNNGDRITGQEGSLFECFVTAYEPYDPWDVITFSDTSEFFDVDPVTGKISFMANFTYTGEHDIKITATDNGTPQANTTRDYKIIIEPSEVFPEVELLNPKDEGILFNLKPQFTWQQTNQEFEDSTIYYDLYLSTSLNSVKNRLKEALLITLKDTTIYIYPDNLTDLTTYYWTVIPNDGLHLGQCKSGIFEFKIDTTIPRPNAILKHPLNDQILNSDTVTLSWDLEYTGRDAVSYDIFFGVSSEELEDPLRAPTTTITQRSYEIKNLYFERNYYWKIRPHTSKVIGEDSEIFSFFITKKVPTIRLLNPVNNSIILPQDEITLTWNINYTQPSKITCILYWSTSPTFTDVTGINVGNNRSYTLTGLEKRTYYWKVIPYLDTLLGFASETWTFAVKEVKVPEAVLKEPINTTLFSTGDSIVVVMSWGVEYEGVFELSDVWFEVYLDNSTNDPGKMTRVTEDNYKQTFYTAVLPFEENLTYYWYVIPHLITDEGPITGICRDGVVHFIFGEPDKIYLGKLELTTHSIKIEAGTQKIVHFILKNLGNQQTTFDITTSVQGTDLINPSPDLKTAVLTVGANSNISLNILVLANVEPGNYNVTVRATAQESTVVYSEDVIMVTVVGELIESDDKGLKKDDGLLSNLALIGIIVVVIVIVILIVVFLLVQRSKAEKRRREERRRKAEERVAAQKEAERSQPSYLTEPTQEAPQVKVSAYKPESVAPVHAASVKPAVTTVTPAAVKPAPAKAALPSAKPAVTTVTTVTPAKPTPTPAKPAVAAKPATAQPQPAKAVAAKPVTAQPQPAKAVAAKPATAQPATAVPAKPATATPKPTEKKDE